MGKKKKGGGKKKKGGGPAAPPGATIEEFIKNYALACKMYGCEPSDCVKRGVETEDGNPTNYVFVDEEVGPAGVRALSSAMLGQHETMKGGKFTNFSSLHFARCNGQADGAVALAELLRVGGDSIPTTNLRLCDCGIDVRGCQALGTALGYGGNITLKRLFLQYDESVGDRGAAALCRGLRMNGVLEVLRIEYCNIGAVGARAVSKVLEYGGTMVKELSLEGNPIGGAGLVYISKAIAKNHVLGELNLKDCGIGAEDLEALEELKNALSVNQTLETLHLVGNFIGDEGTDILASMEEEAKASLKTLWLEYEGVSASAFAAASISKGGKKGKKGKKKKKKK